METRRHNLQNGSKVKSDASNRQVKPDASNHDVQRDAPDRQLKPDVSNRQSNADIYIDQICEFNVRSAIPVARFGSVKRPTRC